MVYHDVKSRERVNGISYDVTRTERGLMVYDVTRAERGLMEYHMTSQEQGEG